MPQSKKTESSVEDTERSEQTETLPASTPSTSESNVDKQENDAAAKARERQERFKALKARAKSANERNLKETAAETQRMATDPNLEKSLARKRDIAEYKLLKADTEAAGEDFWRKRNMDYTILEHEKYDEKRKQAQENRDKVGFHTHGQEAEKVYETQMGRLAPDLEAYENEKKAAIERAAANGDIEFVETADGEVIAIDKNGSFYSNADSVGFADHKPKRAAMDRLVGDITKAEEVRLKKRKERHGDEEADVTYINEKNKQFNQKLARHYNKYTTEIRDSFERGTMI